MKFSSGPARAGLLLVILALSLTVVGCGSHNPTSKVAELDQDVILNLPAFKQARDKLQKIADKKRDELKKKLQSTKSNDEKQNLVQQFQLEMQQQTNKVMLPLKNRAQAAVATVAKQRGAIVVLDKRIVVYGVPDITDQVKKLFDSKGQLTMPKQQDTSQSPIGYFDQDVVRSLKVFQEAEVKVYQKRAELVQELREKASHKKLSPSEKQNLEKEMALQLQAYQQQVMTPLIQEVNSSVADVAKADGLSLVLDKQHVMYGGRNMTNEVVDTFLSKVGSNTSSTSSGAAPAPTASPKPSGGK